MTTGQSPPDPLPDALSAPLEKLVYLFVREQGHATVYDLRDALDVPQLRLYPTLDAMAKRGLVECHGDDVWLPEREPAREPAQARA